MLVLVALGQRRDVRLKGLDFLLEVNHRRVVGNARNGQQLIHVALVLPDLREVALEPHPVGLHRGELGIQVLELVEDDVLLVLKRDGFLHLAVILQRLLGVAHFLLQALRFLHQELQRQFRGPGAAFDRLSDVFTADGVRDQLRNFRVAVLNEDVDQARAAADQRADHSTQRPGEGILAVSAAGVGRRHEIGIAREIQRADHALHERAVAQVLLDRAKLVERAQILRADVLDGENGLRGDVDFQHRAGLVHLRGARDVTDRNQQAGQQQQQDDP